MLSVLYKTGSSLLASSYRFLAVADLHGSIQESLLAARITGSIRHALDWVQTGYMCDVQLHHFTLSFLQDNFKHWNRSFIEIFADFAHAFPRAWRSLILVESRNTAGLQDGAYASLAEILAQSSHGVPEGSKLGPLCFNLKPNTLVKRLRMEKCGLASTAWVPVEWKSHRWSGRGVPDFVTACHVADCVRCAWPLPSALALAQCPGLEATCARALDILDDDRIPILFHADDPVILASSQGEANRCLSIIAEWANDMKVEVHVDPSKTVVQLLAADDFDFQFSPLFFPRRSPLLPGPLTCVKLHKWLGLWWAAHGSWTQHAIAVVAACSGMIDALCSLISCLRAPLCVGILLFELKVESVLRFGRHLWATDNEAMSIIVSAYARWARQLIGADPWRKSAVCQGELGWRCS